MNSFEPVFQQDVYAEREYATQGWKVFYDFYDRLRAQGAPPELLAKVAELTNSYKNLTEGIEAIEACFPKETQ